MAIVTLWMGIGSAFITHRTAAASQTVIDQVNPQRLYEGATPATPSQRRDACQHSCNQRLVKKISMERRAIR